MIMGGDQRIILKVNCDCDVAVQRAAQQSYMLGHPVINGPVIIRTSQFSGSRTLEARVCPICWEYNHSHLPQSEVAPYDLMAQRSPGVPAI